MATIEQDTNSTLWAFPAFFVRRDGRDASEPGFMVRPCDAKGRYVVSYDGITLAKFAYGIQAIDYAVSLAKG